MSMSIVAEPSIVKATILVVDVIYFIKPKTEERAIMVNQGTSVWVWMRRAVPFGAHMSCTSDAL